MKNSSAERIIGPQYISVSSIIAGALVMLAISAILIPFGHAVGLSTSMTLKPENARWAVLSIGLWLLWTQLIASIAGGYFTGRTVSAGVGKQHEIEFRDGTNGLLAWALSTVVAVTSAAIGAFLTAVAAHYNPSNVNHLPQVTDLTKNSLIILGFATAASSVVSGAAAWWMAVLGGEHRDKAVDFSSYIFYRKRK